MQKEIQHLLALLLSDDESNRALGLQLMQSQGLKKPTLAALFPLLPIEGGRFEMGDRAAGGDMAAHRVDLASFFMQDAPVTQQQYQLIMGHNPSYFRYSGDRPVVNLSWYDAIEFCNALSEWADLEPCYTIEKNTPDTHNLHGADYIKWTVWWNLQAKGYRLPTEAEWEFAARGGIHSQGYIYAGGNDLDEVAWYRANSNEQTQPVKGKKPNELGLYDLSGNVFEWCWDWYDKNYYKNSPDVHPTGAEKGYDRIIRGGAWLSKKLDNLRVFSRFQSIPSYSNYSIGFRMVVSAR